MTDLRRHVPPLVLRWDDEAPGASWREIDGTLVFADVSGFTALTERLTRRGRVGAEEIVETLNRVFGPMLRLSAARGGEMLKFGGDALLFLFRGPGHADHACDAAVEMRRTLRDAAALPTSVGRLSLSMSVGVHSGPVHLFLVGSPTRELFVLGPAASATAAAEQAAEAGEVVVTPATAARLAPGSTRVRADGALVLRRRVAHTVPAVSAGTPPVPAARLGGLFPRSLGEYLDPGPPEPEHRLATIAFVRLSGTDRVFDDEGPAHLAGLLDTTVTAVEAALAVEGVTLLATDLDADGGKFFLGSGVPVAGEDDEGRMLRALRRIATSDLPLPVQLGVNRGHVFAAEVGIPERAAYSAMGDTTNTAARITSKAPAGGVFAHPGVLEHSRSLFATASVGPYAMKGKAVPMHLLAVGEETGSQDLRRSARLPFLGRDTELAEAVRMLTEAAAGAGGVLTVEGATGSGKTRLVREATALAPPAERLLLHAEPYGVSSSYRVLRDPLRTLLGVTRDTPERMGAAVLDTLGRVAPELLPMAPLLADVVQVDVPPTVEASRIDPAYQPDRVADVVVTLLDRLVPGPLTVQVEDAHWADGASVALLGRVAGAAATRPWAVVVVRRDAPGGFAPEGGTVLTLGPLPPATVEQLVIAATREHPLRPHEVSLLARRAAGNPLFVEEVTETIRGGGALDTLPESVQAAMAAQIDRLTPPLRQVLRHASVLGRSFRREIIAATLAADGTAFDGTVFDALHAFLEPDGPDRLRFRNSLVRDTAYEGLSFRVRSRVHQTAGEVLERMSSDLDADSPTLALHFDRAGDHARTWRYAQVAGAVARRSFANADAADHLVRALSVSPRLPDVTDRARADLWTGVGELRELAGMFEESLDAYRRGARLVRDDLRAHAALLARQAIVLLRTGRPTAALRVVGRARSVLRGAGEAGAATLVRLDNLTARVRIEQERPGEALRWAERAAERAREVGDRETLVRALILLDSIEISMGVPGLGARHLEALGICVEEEWRPLEETVRGNLGTIAYYAGRWTEAAEWYASARRVALEVGKDFGAAETGVNLAELLINQGRLDEAEVILDDALRVLRASGALSFLAQGEIQLARLHLTRADHDAADALAADVAATLLSLGKPTTALEASLVQADAMIREGHPVQALEVIDAAEHAARAEAAASVPRTCHQRSRALLALGRFAEAGELAETGLVAAREQDLPYDEALLLRVLSRVRRHEGDLDGSDQAWARAESRLASLGARASAPGDAAQAPG
ncbi:adenylate/guanylate cyclase domain-containing protein [Phycicoccus duodecadis]|uniref:Putative ATPase n=1 Tax=Phycicoccus duodecadis TaxID=173053 RepID=A0A2N3YF26_9MICO|nr:adenylate/guanylate cyclase domain-containing protein [Phycicoccus duodecadis]PKW25455.1 putative ATPase [Phycicoccus duodecadis]